MAYEVERQVAVEAVLKACTLCRTVQEALVSEETMAKKDKSPVTVADFGAQAVVSHALAVAFRAHPWPHGGNGGKSEIRPDAPARKAGSPTNYTGSGRGP